MGCRGGTKVGKGERRYGFHRRFGGLIDLFNYDDIGQSIWQNRVGYYLKECLIHSYMKCLRMMILW